MNTRLMIETTKANKAGECNVCIEVSITKLGEKKKTVRIPTNIKVKADSWSAKSQSVIRGKSADYYKVNQTLLTQKELVNDIIAELTSKGRFQLEEIRPLYEAKSAPIAVSFFELYNEFLKLKEQTMTRNGIKDFKTLKTHLLGFEKERKNNIILSQIDHSFFERFEIYLSKQKIVIKAKEGEEPKTKLFADGTIQKNLQTLRLFLNYQANKGMPVNKDYKKFKIKGKPEVALITLEPEEYRLLLSPIDNERLEKTRKLFVLQCSTGLRFSDAIKITKNHVRNNTIYMNSTKTRQKLQIPLNANSLEILQECNFDTSTIAISNQKYNDYIKELCELVEINQPIMKINYRGKKETQESLKKHEIMSSHHGRRFFITQNLINGVRPEVIMSMTGHTDFRSFKKYIAITDQTRINAMELWSKTFA